MKRILILLIGLTINLTLYSHPWKPNHYVIIDTDGGIDDIKTITMLLASPDVRVLAITVSPGALSSGNAYVKVKSLLNSCYHEGIPVGINRKCDFKSPDFQVALNTTWGEETGIEKGNAPDCNILIKEILESEKTKISFICLGGMSTAASALEKVSLFSQQVKEIIWSSNKPENKDSFNFQIDRSSSEKIMKGDIPVRVVPGLEDEIFYTEPFLENISKIHTVYAEKISGFFRSEIAKNHKYSYSGNDEMASLYLHYPGLFQSKPGTNVFICPNENIRQLRDKSLAILAGETVEKNQVIKYFPLDSSFYFTDIRPYVTDIINKYGTDEWISGVIANELHRHLGSFSIVGVKMGIRAREYFDTGVDEFSATSFAGSIPPLSCMNDGIQVSTGATPGHGLLNVRNDTITSASAEFTYMNRKIRLTLKPEIADKIRAELKEINFIYGLDSNIYWELVRKNSIKYWLNLDRHEIFNIEEIH
ncbi:MAG: nucleoside hydrolase [Bacteroidales bacterium]|nr:nucleoside hydrolase [Bacteroidales bacterium]